MKKLLLAFCLSLVTTLPTFAADSPWVGTWKANKDKSHLTGETFTYTKTPDGMMHYDDGTSPGAFRIDGKEYPLQNDRTTAWTATGPNTWDSVLRYKGVIASRIHRTLSADGKTYTISSTSPMPDGSTAQGDFTYTRVSGTSGLEGKWRSVKIDSPDDVVIVSAKADGVLHWDTPATKDVVEGKPDGSDLTITGPRTPAGITVSYKPVSTDILSYVVKDKGKPLYYGTQTLAPDGKSMTDTSWAVGKENEKTSTFYDRQ